MGKVDPKLSVTKNPVIDVIPYLYRYSTYIRRRKGVRKRHTLILGYRVSIRA